MTSFEEYKLTANHVEKLLDRRQLTTSFYLSVNTAIAAVIGLLLKDADLCNGPEYVAEQHINKLTKETDFLAGLSDYFSNPLLFVDIIIAAFCEPLQKRR